MYDEFFLFNSSYFEQIASSTNDKVLKKPFNKILINGFDVVFDCSGANLILNSLLRTTAISGSVILVSNNLNYELFDPTPIWHRDINVMGSHGFDKFFKKDTPTFDFIQSLIVNNDINIDHFRIKKYEFRNFDKLLNEKNNNEMYVRNAVEF